MSIPTRTLPHHSSVAVSETTHDFCAAFRRTPTTIRTWELEGKIPPAIRINGTKLWPAGTIARLLAEASAPAAPASPAGDAA